MALYNWSVQSCCNPSIIKIVRFDPILSAGIIFQDSLNNCYQVVAPTAASPNIFFSNKTQLYKTCEECLQFLIPCDPPKEPTTAWLVQNCCDSAITQIVVNNNILPGDIFQDSLGDCYTVLMITEGNPTIVIIDETTYKICEDCIKCPAPEPSVTPSITQTPFPTQTVTPSITVTPSSTNYNFVSKTPSVTPTATISITPSITPSPGTPECKCITFRNIGDIPRNAFYTTCDGLQNISVQIPRGSSRQYCGGNPTAQSPIQITTGSACIGEECVYPDVSPTPTPTPTVTSVSGSDVTIDDLCMDVVFGSAPSPSATPSITISATPSITVSPSQYPIYPSISPTQTISVTPSITPSITPTKTPSTTVSNTPSVTPTRTVTPTISITATPTISITPTKTPTPTPSASGGSIVVPECSVIYNSIIGNVYSYNNITNVSTLLNLGPSPVQTTQGSSDIAHTSSKLWIYRADGGFFLSEFNITLNSFTSTYNRRINIPSGVGLGDGLCAINDTTLLSSDFFTNKIIQITLNNDNVGQTQPATTTITTLFSLPTGRKISGDLLYTVDGKIIVTTQTINSPFYYYISQYALVNGVWTLEFDKDITSSTPYPFGLATINGGIYIFTGNGDFKQISTTYPYVITQISNIGSNLAGASQVPSCNNISFQPNIIPISPTPTSTTTVSLTPTTTVSPSTTPSRTPTPTPTSSPPSNTTPCPGTLPMPGGSITINGVTLTASGTGCLRLSTSAYASCNTTVPTNTIWAGSNPYCPNSSAFSYTLTFSQPVNNISLPITAIGNGVGENISFTTNIGTPTILSNNNCGCTIVGNQIQSTATLNGGGGLFTISAPSSFTTLTISGQGGQNGSFIGIDCASIIPAPPADCVSCNVLALPPSGVGAVTNGNLTISTTYSGPALFATSFNTSTCTGVNISSNSPILGASIGAFIYTLNFNQPVNNIKFLLGAGGVTSDPTALETFTFNTNGGTPILSTCGTSCGTTINNNVLQLGLVLPYGGGVLTQVKATNPYTQIIITGNGGAAGSIFAICLDTAIPLPSLSPSVTPTKTATPSITPTKTATPSISVSTTPSITPTKTTTPSITPSASPGFAASCNNILYKTQTSQYYSYNFTTNVSTLLSVPVPPYDSVATSLSIPVNNLANTSNKLWSYTWNSNSGNNNNSIVEYNTTSNPFTATINRYIALPKISNEGITPGNGLFAISNTKLIGTIAKIGNFALQSNVSLPTLQPLGEQYGNGIIIAEFDITSNVATWTQKAKLFSGELPATGILLTSNNKLIVITKTNQSPFTRYINQYNYNTGVLEFKQPLPSTINTDCGLAEVNGNIYIMGFNIYKIDTIAPYNLTLIQTTGNQLVASSQIASCIDTNFPISSCPECVSLPLKLTSPMNYNGITIIPSYVGPAQSPSYFAPTDQLNPGPAECCTGLDTIYVPPFTVWLGQQPGDYSYTLTFSQFVNNIKIQYRGTNDNLPSGGPSSIPEVFTWTTNGGTPSISLCKGCYQTINGNTISGSDANSGTPGEIGGGLITITAPSSYTTLTLSGTGRNNGTLFSICSSSIVPAPALSPSPSPIPSLTPTPTPSASPPTTGLLGCVYYSNYSSAATNAWVYDVLTNVSYPITLLNGLPGASINAHTSTRFWKTNQTDTIKEWIIVNNTTTLNLNRTITIYGLSTQLYQIYGLQAVNNTTLLTIAAGTPTSNNPEGNFTYSLARLDITNNTVTAAQMATLFNIYAPAGIQDFLLTTTNKIITVGKRLNSSQLQEIYLSQYSYPDGALELNINLSSLIPPYNASIGINRCKLFESNGNLFLVVLALDSASSIIYNVNLNSPYTLTAVRTITDTYQVAATYNSSLNCNTVNLSPAPSPSPSPSPSAPSSAFRTIYKYLDIQ